MERQWKTRETEREIVQIEERNKKTNREIMGDGKTMMDERDRER